MEKEHYKLEGEGLFGINPISVALGVDNRSFHALYVLESLNSKLNDIIYSKDKSEITDYEFEEKDDGDEPINRYTDRKNIDVLKEIAMRCKELKIPIITVQKQLLDAFSRFRVHQGMVLDASTLTVQQIDELEKHVAKKGDKRMPLYVALDELWDAQNMGAIIRTCHYFGVDGVIINDKGSSPINAFASKSSAGAIEDTPIYKTMSIPGFLKRSKVNNWNVVGTSLGPESKDITTASLTSPTILVIGNEGFGIRDSVLSSNPKIDSLNASVSTGIIIQKLICGNGDGK
eukprot:gene10922-12729_t